MKFSENDLNKYYIDKKTNRVYKLVAYCECPSVTLERLDDKQRFSFGVNGFLAKDFCKMVEEDEQ